MASVSRRTALSTALRAASAGAAVSMAAGLSSCAEGSRGRSGASASPAARPAGPLPALTATGDASVLGSRKVYTSFYPLQPAVPPPSGAPRPAGTSFAAVFTGAGSRVAHTASAAAELSNLLPWDIGGRRLCTFFRQVEDGSPNPQSFRRSEFVLADERLTELATIRRTPTRRHPGPSLLAEMHDIVLLSRSHWLLQDYVKTTVRRRPVWAPYVQEVKDGRVVFEWLGTEHPEVLALAAPKAVRVEGADDAWHLNSMSLHEDGGLILSLRSADAVIKVSRASGEVLWVLGGKGNQFSGAPSFRVQHDARVQNGSLVLFDNGAQQSRGLVLALDEENRRCSDVRSYSLPGRVSRFGGSTRVLEDGLVAVGWGLGRSHAEVLTVFSPDGTPRLSLSAPSAELGVYRTIAA